MKKQIKVYLALMLALITVASSFAFYGCNNSEHELPDTDISIVTSQVTTRLPRRQRQPQRTKLLTRIQSRRIRSKIPSRLRQSLRCMKI